MFTNEKDLLGLGDPLLVYKLRTRLIPFITQLESTHKEVPIVKYNIQSSFKVIYVVVLYFI